MTFKFFKLSVLPLLLAFFLLACERQGPAEELGENIDDMGDKVSDTVKDVGNEIEDACEDVKERADAKDTDC